MVARLNVGIAGAGVLGRLLAWRLARAGYAVTVFDPSPGPQPPVFGALQPQSAHAAGFTAAGMLSPLAELENSGPDIAVLGWRSLALWRVVTDALAPVAQALDEGLRPSWLMRSGGSLLVAHGSDAGMAQRVLARLGQAPDGAAVVPAPQRLERAQLADLEPAMAAHLLAWLLPGEGQILPEKVLPALCAAAPRVCWRWGCTVASVEPGRIVQANGHEASFDLAIDVRGTGARPAWPVRGVRGEVVWLHAPKVPLHRPVRLLHPRHRVYIVPRPQGHIVVGASEIESEDRSPVSLRSAVELMAAAQSVLPELAEARIVHLEANLRPALPDNAPRIDATDGLLRINGLYRHGWLLAPALVEDALLKAELAVPALEPAHV